VVGDAPAYRAHLQTSLLCLELHHLVSGRCKQVGGCPIGSVMTRRRSTDACVFSSRATIAKRLRVIFDQLAHRAQIIVLARNGSLYAGRNRSYAAIVSPIPFGAPIASFTCFPALPDANNPPELRPSTPLI